MSWSLQTQTQIKVKHRSSTCNKIVNRIQRIYAKIIQCKPMTKCSNRCHWNFMPRISKILHATEFVKSTSTNEMKWMSTSTAKCKCFAIDWHWHSIINALRIACHNSCVIIYYRCVSSVVTTYQQSKPINEIVVPRFFNRIRAANAKCNLKRLCQDAEWALVLTVCGLWVLKIDYCVRFQRGRVDVVNVVVHTKLF